jgi:hypothetical protein
LCKNTSENPIWVGVKQIVSHSTAGTRAIFFMPQT